MRFFISIAFVYLVLAQACKEPEDLEPPADVTPSSILVLNEGLFRRGNASISAYDPLLNTSLGTVYDPSTNTTGGLDVLQSATLLGDTIVLVANNSNLIVLLEKETLEEVDRFEALGSPRYLTLMANGQHIVTDLYAERLLILNSDFSQAQSIAQVGQAEASIAFADGALFVSPSRRAVFYYDAVLGQVIDSLSVPLRANAIIQLDENRIAVSGGVLAQGDEGSLAIIDWSNKSIDLLMSFSESESSFYPRLAISEDKLYCLQRKLISLPLSNLNLTAASEITLDGLADPYGFGVSPMNDDFYITDAKNGLATGEVFRFSSEGTPIDTFEVGIFPNGFIFR